MAFPVVASAVTGVASGAVGIAAGYLYMREFDSAVLGQLQGDPKDLRAALHFHDTAAFTTLFGAQGLGHAISYVGVKAEAPGAVVFGLGVSAAALGARIGWSLAQQHSPRH